MELLDSRTNLFHKGGYLHFWHWFTTFELLIKLPSDSDFQNDVDMLFIIETTVHLDDVGVIQVHLNFHFSDELIHNFLFSKHCLFNDLQGTHKTA